MIQDKIYRNLSEIAQIARDGTSIPQVHCGEAGCSEGCCGNLQCTPFAKQRREKERIKDVYRHILVKLTDTLLENP
jgi:hypothetical protein